MPSSNDQASSDQDALLDVVRARLTAAMPSPECELDHDSGWQLLIATILSAQSTDKRVNMVTPDLFARWPGPAELAAATQEEVEEVVRTTGFYRNKAKNIRGSAKVIAEEHGGVVPQDLDALVALPGVARKTANLVLGTAYGVASGVVVDTHAGRVAARLGFTEQKKAPKVEKDLMALLDEHEWIAMGHRLVLHGRYVCLAKKPGCARCPLAEHCPSADGPEGALPEGTWQERADAEGRLVKSRGVDA